MKRPVTSWDHPRLIGEPNGVTVRVTVRVSTLGFAYGAVEHVTGDGVAARIAAGVFDPT